MYDARFTMSKPLPQMGTDNRGKQLANIYIYSYRLSRTQSLADVHVMFVLCNCRGDCFKLFRYKGNLFDAQQFGIRKGVVSGIGMACVFLVMFGAYALAFWYGSTLVREKDYTPGDMMVVSAITSARFP